MVPGRSSASRNRTCRGFTLVELLVVITIIAILIALLLPAVQAAREAARQLQCRNQLKQMSLACLHHEHLHKFFPTGGWTPVWAGDPLRGFDRRQPGGWTYNILPFCDQQALWQLPDDGNAANVTALQKARTDVMLATPLSMFICPSRRRALLYPMNQTSSFWLLVNGDTTTMARTGAARTDYAANVGDTFPGGNAECTDRPADYSSADAWTWPTWLTAYTGVSYVRSEVKVADVTDGLSCTYLIGEKYVDPDYYTTGEDGGDNQYLFVGLDRDTYRWGSNTVNASYCWPQRDCPGNATGHCAFGSAHSNGFQMAFCDGSVQMVNYSIDLVTHAALCNRRDGKVVDGGKF
jgi:prepilin-type N-terminal cleavage/methylation domain-containing protein/prepilin-type processing-associated H-X9-DG protein